MKKIMILGASYSQLPLIEAAKRLGFYTIVASIPGNWPGFEAADEGVFVDISKPAEVLAAAREKQIDGIATCCLDLGVRSIGYVSEELGLVGPSMEAAQIASDKYRMKEAFLKGGVSCAKHCLIQSEDDLEQALKVLEFPLIVKAVDLMGSRGIYRCNTREEVFENYKETMSATGKDYCILEEFIEGTLFGTEAMIKDGEIIYCQPDNTEAFQGYVPSPIGHSVPFEKEAELGSMVRKEVEKAIQAVGLDNCPINCDMLYKDGKVYVIEIAGRAGATCLPEILGLYFGINYYEMIVKLAMGMDVKSAFPKTPVCGAVLAHVLSSETSGYVKAIKNENNEEDYIKEISFNIEPGDYVNQYTNGRDRIGQVILTADSLEQCWERLRSIQSKISIEFKE